MQNSATPQRMRDGFLRRGDQVTRLEAFIDAAFAFAVTLLVISVDSIPDSIDALLVALKGVPAFAVSFAMITLFWSAHARWSKRYGLDDAVTTVLSLTLVFVALIYVYPLKMLFGTLFGYISNGVLPYPISSRVMPTDVRTMYIVYSTGFIALSLCLLGLYLHARRKADVLALDAAERITTDSDLAIYAWFALVGLLSLILSICVEPTNAWRLGLPGNVYFLLAFTGLVEAAARRRSQQRLQASS